MYRVGWSLEVVSGELRGEEGVMMGYYVGGWLYCIQSVFDGVSWLHTVCGEGRGRCQGGCQTI